MTDPAAAKRPRVAIAIALAIMLLACGLIVTALALLSQGAVAQQAAGAIETASAARAMLRNQSDSQVAGAQSVRAARPRDAAPPMTGSFALGVEPTPDELPLQARIAASSVGGGYVAAGRIHVVVEGGAADEPAHQ